MNVQLICADLVTFTINDLTLVDIYNIKFLFGHVSISENQNV